MLEDNIMENIHGVDVSWLHKTHSKDTLKHSSTAPAATNGHTSTPTSETAPTPTSQKNSQHGGSQPRKELPASAPRQIPQRPSMTRNGSSEKVQTGSGNNSKTGSSPGSAPSRRNSWMASISSKFSSSPGAQAAHSTMSTSPNATRSSPAQDGHNQKSPGVNPAKNAASQQGPKSEGNEPYIPAPPRGGQPGFLQSALRRLSSSSGQLAGGNTRLQHGLCERRVLNVDHQRERCRVKELEMAKLRRVAFCVDVEIASGPRYIDEEEDEKHTSREQHNKKKKTERGEGEALKHPDEVKEEKETNGVVQSSGERLPKESAKEGSDSTQERKSDANVAVKAEEVIDKDTKKKEKKKRSEEERKARKEKKRKQAEANGTVPVEVVRDGSETSLATPGSTTPKTQASPTTDPARIYRRCCQLRETPILKKITEQLSSPLNTDRYGVVTKIDLSSYWMQLPDLVTLGDYLAVVPVKELIMENCGLTDEGVRVVLAGLLAAKAPNHSARKKHKGEIPQYTDQHKGVIERVVFKNNPKIGQQGWRHVGLFIHMSRSLKSMDMSMIQFPQPPAPPPDQHDKGHLLHLHRTNSNMQATAHTEGVKTVSNMCCILSKALGERLGGSEFELLNMAETGISTEQLGLLIDGAIKSGLRRLGLAQNSITAEGMTHVARFLKHGKCEGLDLGGNDLKDHLDMLAETFDEDHPLWAISLSSCGLDTDSLWSLFAALSKLKNFRFIDLSHNHDLFATKPTAVSLLRKYLPRMPILKRIHLTDVALTPEQAIAIAETFAESPTLAHVNIMENPELSALASASGESHQEEACALYASLMAAVRVSKSLVCIDVDVPSPESSEIVKALAKQVVAYCLRNMQRDPVAEISEAAALISEPHGGDKEVAIPDVLLHLVGHVEEMQDDDYDPAPDEDYVIGGTGVVKALGICLRNSANDSRRPSADRTHSRSETPTGARTPKRSVPGGKAKDMSKNLLGSARKIRERLQPALIKERQGANRANYQRLLFLDQTLERMIQRFEDEYPETRLPASTATPSTLSPDHESPTETSILSPGTHLTHKNSDELLETSVIDGTASDDEGELRPALSRHNSDVSIASRALSQEEGRMHRFGQHLRREILKPEMEDHAHGTTGHEEWPPHLQLLRSTLEDLGGDELRKKVEAGGQDAVLQELNMEASALRQRVIDSDPEGWRNFQHAQEEMVRNQRMASADPNASAIE